MIPKIIHYCWFGHNPVPELAQKCIASWKRFLPDYEIIEWNEDNFNINCNVYVSEAYAAKKWAFVTDFVRLYALVKYGGIYMDTDVEVINSLDFLLQCEAFSGFESNIDIPTGIMGCVPGQKLFLEFLNYYEGRHFILSDGSFDLTTNVKIITEICTRYGLKRDNTLQNIKGFTLLPSDYLCPKDYQTGEIRLTDRTLTIHHFNGSWKTKEDMEVIELGRKFSRVFGVRIGYNLAEYQKAAERGGIKGVILITREKVGRIVRKVKLPTGKERVICMIKQKLKKIVRGGHDRYHVDSSASFVRCICIHRMQILRHMEAAA